MLHYRKKLLLNKKDFLVRSLEIKLTNSKKLHFPDFIIIGAQKAGTTWLHNHLSNHEEVYFPKLEGVHDPSELKYFDTRLCNSIKWYSDLYKNNNGKIKGEKSPGYYFMPVERIKMVKQLMPDLKVILILRNPVERAWSQAVMNLRQFHQKNYEENKADYIDFLNTSLYRGMYSNYIKNWQKFYSEDQFKIYLYDEIKNDPLSLITKIAKFINIKSNYSTFSEINLKKKINKNPPEPMPEEVRNMLAQAYQKEVSILCNELHLEVNDWLYEVAV
ncbi:hypothetical protein BH23BAC1_BH23BAC1_42230 [soil metagenome]